MWLSISVGSKVSRASATVAMRCLLSVGYYPQGYKQCTPAAHSATAAGVPVRPPCALATRLPPTHFNHRWQWEAWHRATAPPQRGLASPGMRDQLRRLASIFHATVDLPVVDLGSAWRRHRRARRRTMTRRSGRVRVSAPSVEQADQAAV